MGYWEDYESLWPQIDADPNELSDGRCWNVFLDQIKHSKTILTPVATTTIGAPNKVLRKRDKKANQKGTPLPLTTEIGDR